MATIRSLVQGVPSSGSIVTCFAVDQYSLTRSFAPSKETFTQRPTLEWKRNDLSRQGRKLAHVQDTANGSLLQLIYTLLTHMYISSDGRHFSTISKNNRSCCNAGVIRLSQSQGLQVLGLGLPPSQPQETRRRGRSRAT